MGTRLEEFQKLSRDDPSAFAPPSAFGPFRVLHQVGVGALGPVFRTYEPTRDRLVAVKVFRLDITPEQAQSLAEALSVAADAGLFHPSIVEPIAAGVEGTVAYRAEEYVAAESLDVALRHYAPASMSRVLPVVTQLAGAVDFARTSGVGHGALHPRDIFVTPDEARATGFGVVEALERVGLRAPVRRPYSAPERVAAGPWGTPADVFSLAAITYELLTGRRPSGTGAQIGSLDGAVVGRETAPLVHAVLARAMHEDPRQRFATALELAAALDAASEGRPPERPSVVAPATAAAPIIASAAQEDEHEADIEHDAVASESPTDDVDDVASERDLDEAFAAFAASESTDAESAENGTLFTDEHDEAVEDLALDPQTVHETERFADEFAAASIPASSASLYEPNARDQAGEEEADRYLGVAAATAPSAATYHESPSPSYYRDDATTAARTGPSWAAVAGLVVLALLVGFLAGQMIDPAGRSEDASAAQANADRTGSDRSTGSVEPPPANQPSPTPLKEEVPAPPPAAEPPAPVATAPTPSPEATTTKPAASRTGSLTVRSTPSGASVTVDGQWRGRTPLSLEGVDFGRHQVRVVQQGFAVAMEDVTLSPSTPARTLSVRLQRTRPATPPARPAASTTSPEKSPGYTGSIYIDSLPRGAQVFINGRVVGTTPLLVPDVPVGSQIVRLQLEEHRTWSTSVRVVAGQQIKVSGSLDRIR